ncbi:hypothetical protein Tco_0600005 [Tanacetum coccineum]|uniref:Uncharacterized protein n=1 Tax=Tanacetum coccineum TaxID=301880 RepID=A0ABQ4WAI3_9ASTR
MVAYLEKSTKHADFDEIVDFLNASPIRYALTIENLTPTFNDEYATPSHTKKDFANMRRKGKDFSRTVMPLFATMLIQPQANVGDGLGQPTKPQHTPTTASPSHVEQIPNVASSSQPQNTHRPRKTKRPTEISQSSGPTTLVADETVHEKRGDSMERDATTAASLDAEQDSGSGPRHQGTILGDRPAQTRFESLSKQSNDPPLSRVNTLGSGEDIMKLNELIDICTKLSDRVLALENVKTTQDLEITSLKKRVNKLEKKKKARTPQLKRRLFKVIIESSVDKSLGDQEDASKQGRNEDQDEDISCAPITTVGVSVSTAEPSTPPTSTNVIKDEDLTIAQTLMKMRSEKSKEKAKEKGSKEKSSEPATRPIRGVTMQEPSESGIRKSVPPSQHDPKDKGKAKMIKLENPLKKKDQIKFDKEVARRIAEELEVELEEE